jgi:hypothetical protein
VLRPEARKGGVWRPGRIGTPGRDGDRPVRDGGRG